MTCPKSSLWHRRLAGGDTGETPMPQGKSLCVCTYYSGDMKFTRPPTARRGEQAGELTRFWRRRHPSSATGGRRYFPIASAIFTTWRARLTTGGSIILLPRETAPRPLASAS